jgi:hypothetical protein
MQILLIDRSDLNMNDVKCILIKSKIFNELICHDSKYVQVALKTEFESYSLNTKKLFYDKK